MKGNRRNHRAFHDSTSFLEALGNSVPRPLRHSVQRQFLLAEIRCRSEIRMVVLILQNGFQMDVSGFSSRRYQNLCWNLSWVFPFIWLYYFTTQSGQVQNKTLPIHQKSRFTSFAAVPESDKGSIFFGKDGSFHNLIRYGNTSDQTKGFWFHSYLLLKFDMFIVDSLKNHKRFFFWKQSYCKDI